MCGGVVRSNNGEGVWCVVTVCGVVALGNSGEGVWCCLQIPVSGDVLANNN